MEFKLSKTVIIAGLVFAGAIVAEFATQNPTYTGMGAILGAVIASLIQFEQQQPDQAK